MYLTKLVTPSLESAYWSGFIMADGSIQDNKRLKIAVASKDRDHLQSFVNFLGHPRDVANYGHYVSWSLQEPETISIWTTLLDAKPRKTYNPPDNLPVGYGEKEMKAFFIGMIDGDGSIRKQSGGRRASFMSMKMHSSWQYYLTLLRAELNLDATIRINPQGYVEMTIGKHGILADYKMFAIENSLPLLERKWERVDEALVTRGGLAVEVAMRLHRGMTPKQIVEETSCSPSYVSVIKKRMNQDGSFYVLAP